MTDSEPLTVAINFLNLYQTQYSQVDKLWSYFGTVTLAVLAFTLGSEKATKTLPEAGIIILGYAVFCVGNFTALLKGQQQLKELAHFATQKSQVASIPLRQLNPLDTSSVGWFYWCVVVAVCGGILFITRWRHSGIPSNTPSAF